MEQAHRVLQCLSSCLDPSVRQAAETQLQEEASRELYGVVLAKIALAPEVSIELRQLAAVLLRQYIKTHWVEGERGFVPPQTSESDKHQIRQALPSGLHDPSSKIRTAVGMAIAAIANWDWPQAWPGLMEFLTAAIKERKDPNLGTQLVHRNTHAICHSDV